MELTAEKAPIKTSRNAQEIDGLARRSGSFQFGSTRISDCGFTLIELLVVVTLIGVLTVLAVTRLDSVISWKQRSDLRQFANVWEHLFNEALGRGEAYRLIIDLDDNSYLVRREIPLDRDNVKQVDYLNEFRLESEKRRRAEKELEQTKSLEEEYEEEDRRQGSHLEELFYNTVYRDPFDDVRLGTPLEFPGLAKRRRLADGLNFRDVKLQNELIDKGQVFIHLSPLGASEFAVVHFTVEDTVVTVMINPATGKVSIEEGDLDFEWSLGRKREERS